MPKLGLTIEEGTVKSWNKTAGSAVAAGEVIAVVEADKASFEIEAPAAGVLAEILVAEEETVAVGTEIAVIVT